MVSCLWEEIKLNVFIVATNSLCVRTGENNLRRQRGNKTKAYKPKSLLCCNNLIIFSNLLTDQGLGGFIFKVFNVSYCVWLDKLIHFFVRAQSKAQKYILSKYSPTYHYLMLKMLFSKSWTSRCWMLWGCKTVKEVPLWPSVKKIKNKISSSLTQVFAFCLINLGHTLYSLYYLFYSLIINLDSQYKKRVVTYFSWKFH